MRLGNRYSSECRPALRIHANSDSRACFLIFELHGPPSLLLHKDGTRGDPPVAYIADAQLHQVTYDRFWVDICHYRSNPIAVVTPWRVLRRSIFYWTLYVRFILDQG
jgi:hypothetical protein